MDFDDLSGLEQRFYDEGYLEGFRHGKDHGVAEGLAMGQKVGYELWEEIGFYEGFAKVWGVTIGKDVTEGAAGGVATANSSNTKDERIVHAAHGLLELISQFPMVNPSTLATKSLDSSGAQPKYNPEMDVIQALGQIRSKFKMLYSLIGVKPASLDRPIPEAEADTTTKGGNSQGPSQLRRIKSPKGTSGKVWHVNEPQENGSPRPNTIGSLEF